jgi:hypothetical protein
LRFNTFGGRGVQLAEKVKRERVGRVSCADVRLLGVVVVAHLLSSGSASGQTTARFAAASGIHRQRIIKPPR